MRVEKATVLLVLKRLALSRSTYKLIGLLIVATGFAQGSVVMDWVSTLVCVATGGCAD
ncbi:hypothetical protein PssvBMR2_gp53 [Pseudomonas phage MR2]|uniref:Uncharacterized protein n=1 Tax=Pseudomonas phage MR2 TaxID=2711170 RepID=A0A6M3T8V8_9CAUD|nr:hypothetical protein PssvBMR2_gp53 [Pseudomonas phage MR2]